MPTQHKSVGLTLKELLSEQLQVPGQSVDNICHSVHTQVLSACCSRDYKLLAVF